MKTPIAEESSGGNSHHDPEKIDEKYEDSAGGRSQKDTLAATGSVSNSAEDTSSEKALDMEESATTGEKPTVRTDEITDVPEKKVYHYEKAEKVLANLNEGLPDKVDDGFGKKEPFETQSVVEEFQENPIEASAEATTAYEIARSGIATLEGEVQASVKSTATKEDEAAMPKYDDKSEKATEVGDSIDDKAKPEGRGDIEIEATEITETDAVCGDTKCTEVEEPESTPAQGEVEASTTRIEVEETKSADIEVTPNIFIEINTDIEANLENRAQIATKSDEMIANETEQDERNEVKIEQDERPGTQGEAIAGSTEINTEETVTIEVKAEVSPGEEYSIEESQSTGVRVEETEDVQGKVQQVEGTEVDAKVTEGGEARTDELVTDANIEPSVSDQVQPEAERSTTLIPEKATVLEVGAAKIEISGANVEVTEDTQTNADKTAHPEAETDRTEIGNIEANRNVPEPKTDCAEHTEVKPEKLEMYEAKCDNSESTEAVAEEADVTEVEDKELESADHKVDGNQTEVEAIATEIEDVKAAGTRAEESDTTRQHFEKNTDGGAKPDKEETNEIGIETTEGIDVDTKVSERIGFKVDEPEVTRIWEVETLSALNTQIKTEVADGDELTEDIKAAGTTEAEVEVATSTGEQIDNVANSANLADTRSAETSITTPETVETETTEAKTEQVTDIQTETEMTGNTEVNSESTETSKNGVGVAGNTGGKDDVLQGIEEDFDTISTKIEPEANETTEMNRVTADAKVEVEMNEDTKSQSGEVAAVVVAVIDVETGTDTRSEVRVEVNVEAGGTTEAMDGAIEKSGGVDVESSNENEASHVKETGSEDAIAAFGEAMGTAETDSLEAADAAIVQIELPKVQLEVNEDGEPKVEQDIAAIETVEEEGEESKATGGDVAKRSEGEEPGDKGVSVDVTEEATDIARLSEDKAEEIKQNTVEEVTSENNSNEDAIEQQVENVTLITLEDANTAAEDIIEKLLGTENVTEFITEDDSEKKDAEHDKSEEKSDKKDDTVIKGTVKSPKAKRRPRSPEKKVNPYRDQRGCFRRIHRLHTNTRN